MTPTEAAEFSKRFNEAHKRHDLIMDRVLNPGYREQRKALVGAIIEAQDEIRDLLREWQEF
jgi:hypothetical protein